MISALSEALLKRRHLRGEAQLQVYDAVWRMTGFLGRERINSRCFGSVVLKESPYSVRLQQ